MSNKTTNTSSGIGFVGLLTILFIALKLTKVINWSWIWILSPLWISFGLAVGIILLLIAFSLWCVGMDKEGKL